MILGCLKILRCRHAAPPVWSKIMVRPFEKENRNDFLKKGKQHMLVVAAFVPNQLHSTDIVQGFAFAIALKRAQGWSPWLIFNMLLSGRW